MKPVKQYISTSGVASAADLCWINREGTVSYRESTRQQSQTSKKPAESSSVAPWSKFMPPKVETSNNFDVLSGVAKLNVNGVVPAPASAPKKKKEEAVLDDWESFEA
jgi:hypothetical protein